MDDGRAFWDARAASWERDADRLDALSDAFGRPALDRLGLAPGERVLDLGCGPGTTAVALAAAVGPEGEVVALDVSPLMVEAAARRAASAGPPAAAIVRTLVADVEHDEIGSGLDAAYSRFGLMFFHDAPAAFARIAAALRPGGRLGTCAWAGLEANPWLVVPTLSALGPLEAVPTLPGPGEPGPFSLADPERVADVLGGAGFVDVEVEVVEATQVVPEADAEAEIGGLLAAGPLAEAYESAAAPARAEAVAAVREALAPFAVDGGWGLPAAALVITARTAG
jgi:SAM-dependent methyltransferase